MFFTFALLAQKSVPLEQRIDETLKQLTLDEKVALLHAQSKFSSAGVPRLGIPENWMSDGPHGIRNEVLWDEWYAAGWTNDSCIAFPALTCLAATWNPEMAALYGNAIGQEARYRNKNVLLGPGVNIYRTPLNGRNFEYMGEDPYLAAQMVVPYVWNVQKNGVAACVKHYALNNQEVDRGHINVIVDERALHEIYLPAFKAAVQQGGAWAIMGAYNQYKNQHACHNQYLLNDILKRDWAFDGVVISDWGGAHNTEQAIINGLDMEFGSWTDGMRANKSNAYDLYYLANPYLELLRNGKTDVKTLDDKVRRVLRLIFRTNMADERHFGSFGTSEHAAVGRKIAEEGIVLLKNTNINAKIAKTNKTSALPVLPVDLSSTKTILVVGENAVKRMTIGGGSSSLKAKYEISPLQGIKNRVGNAAEVIYVKGYESPATKEPDVKNAKNPDKKNIDYAALRAEAVAAARNADVVLFFGGLNKNEHQDCEGGDRETYDLPYQQNELITELLKANPRTAVVMISGNAVAMPWAKTASAILEAWYGGTETGNAIAAVLFGDVNPSGKLPFSFYEKLTDAAAHSLGDYPGDGTNVEYKDGIFVGYRWLEKQKIAPAFAFGHGLSYTTFRYDKITADKTSISENDKITFNLTVTNTGKFDGAEVVQLYISDKQSSIERPAKELKAFKKVFLKAGETQNVSLTIDKTALSFYDVTRHDWTAEQGTFEALIGSSSADIRAKISFELKNN
ncbi:MAG: glycoside hydrolase family 3 C-terminal domain-containing protein [Paludibacter sp.]|jgi:beta-glucosidase|nr:glycoside hydrolase family 3 C-terminal domain-containing protein [Paludibacter sp.]